MVCQTGSGRRICPQLAQNGPRSAGKGRVGIETPKQVEAVRLAILASKKLDQKLPQNSEFFGPKIAPKLNEKGPFSGPFLFVYVSQFSQRSPGKCQPDSKGSRHL